MNATAQWLTTMFFGMGSSITLIYARRSLAKARVVASGRASRDREQDDHELATVMAGGPEAGD